MERGLVAEIAGCPPEILAPPETCCLARNCGSPFPVHLCESMTEFLAVEYDVKIQACPIKVFISPTILFSSGLMITPRKTLEATWRWQKFGHLGPWMPEDQDLLSFNSILPPSHPFPYPCWFNFTMWIRSQLTVVILLLLLFWALRFHFCTSLFSNPSSEILMESLPCIWGFSPAFLLIKHI